MPDETLALYLDAPLQSWGYQSRFDRRTSLSYPTRSGILGMISAAMGLNRADPGELKRFEHVRLTVLAFGGGPRLVDYQTVGGGYDKAVDRRHIPVTADGKTGATVQTYREYLQDARFGVLLEGERGLLHEISAALRDPKWGVWLGRKCCVPASTISCGVFESSQEAEAHLHAIEASRPTPPAEHRMPPRRFVEVTDFDEGTETLMDRPKDFAKRAFGLRRIGER